jgi:hypothetical protein
MYHPVIFGGTEKNRGNLRKTEVPADTPKGNLPSVSLYHYCYINVLGVYFIF